MTLFAPNEILQYIAWFLAAVEFILALYVLLLNPWHIANRHVSVLLFLGALTTLAQGLLLGAANVEQAYLPTVILAATVVPIQPVLLIVSVVLLKPGWLPGSGRARGRGRWRWLWVLAYVFAFVPFVLTMIDITLGTQLWYTGLDPATYQQGAVSTADFTNGAWASPIKLLAFQIIPLLTFVPLLYVALRDKGVTPLTRRLAWLLILQQVSIVGVSLGLREVLPVPIPDLLAAAIFVFTYTYVIFQQMVSERRVQRGRLQTRLTVLILAAAVPLLVAVAALVSVWANGVIEEKADEQLSITSRALTSNLSTWLDLNVQALEQLVITPDIISMNPDRQKPLLEAMDRAHPLIYLVSTTDMDGINVARSDDVAPKDYSDRRWVIEARQGEPTFQVLVGRTSGEPALVISLPIRNDSGVIVGVGMLASDLDDVTAAVHATRVGETGYAFVVNEANEVVVHPIPEDAAVLQDLDDDPAVRVLRQGFHGGVRFQDQEGNYWRAHVDELDSGWGVIVQQPEAELLRDTQAVLTISGIAIVLGILILSALTLLTVRQAIRPVGALTEMATAISAGDLERTATVESEDEIGTLASAFNSMTSQLRNLIDSLEQQVADRTRDLVQRSAYLEATAEVGRAAASMLEADQLIQEVVELIRDRFGLYYVGLFLVEEAGGGVPVGESVGEWAVLRAGTGEAGRAMLARGHRIRVGEGMIGWSVAQGQLRVAQVAEEDAVRLATAELPETRSEAALPLRSRGRVLGALSVQHTRPGVFDEDTVAVLQTMADQVAVALENARLFSASQAALEATRHAYGELSREAWDELLRPRTGWGFRYAQQRVVPSDGAWRSEMLQARQTGELAQGDGDSDSTLAIPLKVRDQVVGVLGFRKGQGDAWTQDEVELLESFATQLEAALEGARLYQETQQRALQEQLTSEITARMRETLDVDTVLRTAIREMGTALGIPRVEVRMTTAGTQARLERE